MTIRRLRKSDLPAYGALCRYCFGGTTADSAAQYMNWVGRSLAHSWGAFENGRLCAGMWYYPYRMRVGDRFLPMGGVEAVATAAESRDAGLARKLMRKAHEQMRVEGRSLAVLQPFQHAFYARMGYGNAFFHHEANFAPQQIARRETSGTHLRPVDGKKEWPLLETLRQKHGGHDFGTVKRDARYWDTKLLTGDRGIRQVYLIERRGTAEGYLITDLGPGAKNSDERLFVVEAVWSSQEAFDALMQLLRSHRDQVKKIAWYLPIDVPLHDQMDDPLIEVKLMPKMMLKLVDFKGALESRAYADEPAGEVVFDLPGDDTSPWNRGRWRARWDSGGVRVTKTRRTDTKKTLVQADMGTMAVLYAGRRGAHDLRAAGLLQASDESCDLLEEAFPAQTPFISEWF